MINMLSHLFKNFFFNFSINLKISSPCMWSELFLAISALLSNYFELGNNCILCFNSLINLFQNNVIKSNKNTSLETVI